MTGAYMRVIRDGNVQNIEVEHMTDEERAEHFPEDSRSIWFLNLVCHKLVECEKLLDSLADDGIIGRV